MRLPFVVERTEQMFEQQKQFIGNASHEIQTPLAICRNRLEMLMEDDSSRKTTGRTDENAIRLECHH